MSTYRLDLLFLPPSKDSLPGPAISHVAVKQCSHGGYPGAPADLPLISNQCMSYQEIASEIDRLIGELKELKRKARKKYDTFARHERKRFTKKPN